ncbi:pyruvate kinase [Tistrella bauzanensis]|uniref:Pyruvate kinase n=1 Tax=Tistrella bauzanensis TaxID=657419 RepID=A0ABQ1J4T0_9PROT|nr:pyruvate kinase [Tistrella bauzanensis]GGB58717.1 pyruvate kinase [Tistrella bauzanensis]
MSIPPRRDRAAKIIATLGPASADDAAIRRLFLAGADVFRVNMSHGDHPTHAGVIAAIRRVEADMGRPIAIMADLQGPKLRIGTLPDDGIGLAVGDSFTLCLNETEGNANRVALPHPEIFAAARAGDRLLLDDGRMVLRITAVDDGEIGTRVETGGHLSSRKGVNVPDAALDLAAITPKDRVDLDFALDQGVDLVALSFLQSARDVQALRRLVGNRARIVAKLEKPQALDDLAAVVEAADAIMVARGDLGVELGAAAVPIAQRRVIKAARAAGRPVIVATQMLESMIEAPVPTRAEASDVATAIYGEADAVMLSAETAIGRHGVAAVTVMDSIIRKVEADMAADIEPQAFATPVEKGAPVPKAVSRAVREIAASLDCAAVVTFTSSGHTALAIARERPVSPILGLTPDIGTARFLALVWGVHSLRSAEVDTMPDMMEIVHDCVARSGIARAGDVVVITAGIPLRTPGTTNLIRVATI